MSTNNDNTPAQDTRFWHRLSTRQKWGAVAAVAAVLLILVCRQHIAIAIGYNDTDEMSAGVRFIRDIAILGAGAFGLFLAMRRSAALDKQAQAANEQAETANKQTKTANEQARVANKQAQTAARRLLIEQFANAVELMAKETSGKKPKPAIASRIGGIYIMADLATKQPEEFAKQVVINLIAYVKENAQRTAALPPTKEEEPSKVRILGDDVKAAFSTLSGILGNEAIKKDIADESLDFSYQDFSGLYFYGIDLQHFTRWEETNFSGCFLTGARFADGANMLGANFSRSWLRGAIFSRAKLECADFRGAVLERVCMRGAKLQGAYMQGCFMSYAELQKADNGEKTDLLEAQLAGANLMGADLNGALIYKTDIRGAVLSSGANLTDIQHLIDAILGETYMINARIETSVVSKLSKWAESAGRKIWLDHTDIAKQNSSPKTDWRLKEYGDGYALAGVLANFAEGPSFEYFWRSPISHLREELFNIQRQAAELDLDDLPPNTPKEVREWLEKIKPKYSK